MPFVDTKHFCKKLINISFCSGMFRVLVLSTSFESSPHTPRHRVLHQEVGLKPVTSGSNARSSNPYYTCAQVKKEKNQKLIM
uniref:Uncharacterized protein n=1 Tax=Scleropages formosus TaxID=113540 RepID=A0A8C9TRF8_SCLFO